VQALSRVRWRGGRRIGAGLDLALATGWTYAWQRSRERRAWAAARSRARNEAYQEIWGQAAAELGVEMESLGDGLFEFSGAGVAVRTERGRSPIDDQRLIAATGDKPGDYRRLSSIGVTVPRHGEYSVEDQRPALEFLAAAPGACVVKPAVDTGAGVGVTTGIRSRDDLARATLRASQAGDRLLIEEEAPGDDYRILILDGTVLDTVRRRPPLVTGDGRSRIARLVGAENRRRLAGDPLERLRMLTLDLDSLIALERQGLNPRSVPAAGRRVVLKGVVNQNAAADNETVTEPLADDLRSAALAAAGAIGLRLAGVDIVSPDPAAGGDGGPVVLEVNPHPGIHHHYAVADRERATPVAVPILRALLSEPGERAKEGSDVQ
jgi:D-alanine-D-alanine ligase-like ATP-grasp enzyme